jgi:hypothetical protein
LIDAVAYDITQTGKDKAGCGYFAYSLIRALAEIGCTMNIYCSILLASSPGMSKHHLPHAAFTILILSWGPSMLPRSVSGITHLQI